MALTKRFGLERFGGLLGGSISDDGARFSLSDRDTLDSLLAAYETHAHGGGNRLADPSSPPTLTLQTGGSLPGGVTYYYRVGLVDQFGLETMAGPEVSVVSTSQVQPPGVPQVLGAAGGTLAPGLYYYAGTAVDAAGVETPLGQPMLYTVNAPNFTATITYPALPAGAVSINTWRQGPADAGYTKLGGSTSLTFSDNGSVPSDPVAGFNPTHQPPSVNNTGSSGEVVVSLTGSDLVAVTGGGGVVPAGGGTPTSVIGTPVRSWKLYRSTSPGDYGFNALVKEIVERDASGRLQASYTDTGSTAQTSGSPQIQSQTLTPSSILVSSPVALVYAPAAERDIAIPAVSTVIDSTVLRLAVVVPPSGSYLVTLTASVAISGAPNVAGQPVSGGPPVNLFWGLSVGGVQVATEHVASVVFTTGARVYEARFLLTGRPASTQELLDWTHNVDTANANTQFQAAVGKSAIMSTQPL